MLDDVELTARHHLRRWTVETFVFSSVVARSDDNSRWCAVRSFVEQVSQCEETKRESLETEDQREQVAPHRPVVVNEARAGDVLARLLPRLASFVDQRTKQDRSWYVAWNRWIINKCHQQIKISWRNMVRCPSKNRREFIGPEILSIFDWGLHRRTDDYQEAIALVPSGLYSIRK